MLPRVELARLGYIRCEFNKLDKGLGRSEPERGAIGAWSTTCQWFSTVEMFEFASQDNDRLATFRNVSIDKEKTWDSNNKSGT